MFSMGFFWNLCDGACIIDLIDGCFGSENLTCACHISAPSTVAWQNLGPRD